MEKAAGYGSVLGLSSITALMEQLHNPQDKLKIIHVAGTNGKGSVCAFLQQILIEAGYRIGLYTSPAVFEYRERFLVQKKQITDEIFYECVDKVKKACEKIVAEEQPHPTLFEIETAVAFLFFLREKCDVVIVEVGMGGATDATNVISKSLCSVFASIGKDHTQFLGDTLKEIAEVKAGIIKEKGAVVSIWQEKEVLDVLQNTALEKQASFLLAEKKKRMLEKGNTFCFSYKDYKKIELSMAGTFQLDNCVLALEVISFLKTKGFDISDEAVKTGVKKTNWHGRMEKICNAPRFYIDGAHNVPAVKRLAETLEKDFTNQTRTFIIGVLADKEHGKMLQEILPYAKDVITVTPQNERALPAHDLLEEIRSLGYKAEESRTMEEAVAMAGQKGNDMILAFGSLSYLAELKKNVLQWEKEHNDV